MSIARSRFCQLAIAKLGAVVLWGELDCSELVALCLLGVGAPDMTKTHRAQTLADETPNLVTAPGAEPLPGDLCFYGTDAGNISHVAIWLAGGGCISADGATSRIKDLKTAKANPGARVRFHDSADFRKDQPYFAIHRNTYLDAIDRVSR